MADRPCTRQLTRRFRSQRTRRGVRDLAGDYAVALATEALARMEMPASRAPRIFAVLCADADRRGDRTAPTCVGKARDVEAKYRLKPAATPGKVLAYRRAAGGASARGLERSIASRFRSVSRSSPR